MGNESPSYDNEVYCSPDGMTRGKTQSPPKKLTLGSMSGEQGWEFRAARWPRDLDFCTGGSIKIIQVDGQSAVAAIDFS